VSEARPSTFVALALVYRTEAEARASVAFEVPRYRGVWLPDAPDGLLIHVFSAEADAQLVGRGWRRLTAADRRKRLRLEQRMRASAERCQVSLSEWTAMTRAERKSRKSRRPAPPPAGERKAMEIPDAIRALSDKTEDDDDG
jgi:hypothetical protein